EHVLFLVAGRADHVEPVLVDIDMAGGAAHGPAAFGLDVEAPVADHFHDAPALEPFEFVVFTGLVCDMDNHGRVLNFRRRRASSAAWWNWSYTGTRPVHPVRRFSWPPAPSAPLRGSRTG